MKMLISDCMEEFKNYVQSYCADATVEYYILNLHFLERYILERYGTLEIDINVLQKKDFVNYITYHKNRKVKNTSVRTYARAVKVFLKYCYNEGYLLTDITRNVKYPKSDNSVIVPLSYERVSLLEDKIKCSCLAERNLCIFHLMLDCGLRLSEVVNLNYCDIDFDNHLLILRNCKNNKNRMLPLPGSVENLLVDYARSIHRYPGTYNYGDCVFLGNDLKKRISKNAISLMFSKLKIVDPDVYPHLLRHTFATSFILGGGSLEILRILLGHDDYNVTKQYLHIATQLQIANYDIYKLDDVFFRIYNYNRI